MNLLSYLAFAVVLISSATTIYVLYSDSRSRVNRAYSLVAFAIAIWAFGYMFVYPSTSGKDIDNWYRIASIGYILLPSLLLNFSITYADQTQKYSWWLLLLLIGPPAVMLYKNFTGHLYAAGFVATPFGNRIVIDTESIWPKLYILYSFYILASVVIFFKRLRNTPSKREKKQLIFFITGNLITYILVYICNIFIPLFTDNIPAIGALVTIISVVTVLFAIIRYKMMRLNPDSLSDRVYNKIYDAVLLLQPNGEIIDVNPSAVDLLCKNRESLIGKLAIDFMEDKSAFQQSLDTISIKKTNIRRESSSFFNASGDTLYTEINLSPILDDFDDFIGIIMIMKFFSPIESLVKQYNISKREKLVAELFARGKSREQIADELFISPGTVKNHLFNIYQKTGVKNRMELYRLLFL